MTVGKGVVAATAGLFLTLGCGQASTSAGSAEGSPSGCRTTSETTPVPEATEGLAIYGYFVELTTSQYLDEAEAVVRGTILDTMVQDLEVAPDSELAGLDQEIVNVDVHEVLDGAAPAELTISRTVSSEELSIEGTRYAGEFALCQEYILVLGSGVEATGSEGMFTLFGVDSVVPVADGVAAQRPSLAGGGPPVPIERLRGIAEQGR